MSYLTSDVLERLTARIHARVDEFGRESLHLTKPATWATTQAHLSRLGLTWSELAKAAGLKIVPRGQRAEQVAA